MASASGSWDFSILPEVVWVNVFSQLGLSDRNRVSRTCIRLSEVFRHPSLWHSVRIILLGDGDADDSHVAKARKNFGIIMPERYSAMINAFGAFFQDVELIILGHMREIRQSCEDVISQLAKNCRLASLTLEIGEPVNHASTRKPPKESSLKVIGSLISEAFRLKSLNLISWPIHQDHNDYDILCCVRKNAHIMDLEKLRIFERDAKADTWFPRNIALPDKDEVRLTVAHFQRLTSLGIHADLLTESLLLELSNLKWFNNLGLLLIQSTDTSLESIQGAAWKSLVTKHPNLKVSATLGNTLPSYEFIQFFKSDIPLVSISFSKYTRYQSHMVEHLSACYSNTLTTFKDFGDGLGDGNVVLLSLVTRCSRVNHFVYYGELRDSTILSLAKSRKHKWITFQVKLQDISSIEEGDEDEVIGITGTGDVFVKAHQPSSGFYYTDESVELRRKTQETVIERICEVLQRKWFPLS